MPRVAVRLPVVRARAVFSLEVPFEEVIGHDADGGREGERLAGHRRDGLEGNRIVHCLASA
jgi:hypothetical protein